MSLKNVIPSIVQQNLVVNSGVEIAKILERDKEKMLEDSDNLFGLDPVLEAERDKCI
jgi:hypothetical protein